MSDKLPYQCEYGDCESPREGSTTFCASHNKAFRRLAKDLKKVPKQRVPLKKVSEGKKLVNDEYSKLRKEYLDHVRVCEIQLSGCTRKATQIHHTSTSADDFLNTDTWDACCFQCHEKTENMPAEERRKLNLLI